MDFADPGQDIDFQGLATDASLPGVSAGNGEAPGETVVGGGVGGPVDLALAQTTFPQYAQDAQGLYPDGWSEAAPSPGQPDDGGAGALNAMASPVGDFWGKVGGVIAKPLNAVGDEIGDFWRGLCVGTDKIEKKLIPPTPPPPPILKKIDWSKTPAVPPTEVNPLDD